MSTHVCRGRVVYNDSAAPCVTVFGFGPESAASQVADTPCLSDFPERPQGSLWPETG